MTTAHHDSLPIRSQLPNPSRRQLLRAGGFGALALLAGCSNVVSNTSSESNGQIQFRGWSFQIKGEGPAVKQLVAAYEKSHKVKVKEISLPYESYLDQLILQLRSADASGLVQVNLDWLSTVVATKKVKQLGSLDGAGYTPEAIKAGQLDGVQYGMPWTASAIGLVANPELLAKADTSGKFGAIDEFEQELVALSKLKGVTPYAAITAIAELKDIVPWIRTFGGTIIEDGKVTLGDAASVEAVTWYKSLLDRKLIAPSMDRFTARSLFAKGKVGFYDDAPLAKASLLGSDNTELAEKVRPAARPIGPSGRPEALSWGRLLVVLSSEDTGPAEKLARHLTADSAAALKYFAETSLPPVTEETLGDAAVQKDEFMAAFQKEIVPTAAASPFWTYPKFQNMEKTLSEAVQSVLVGKDDAKSALTSAGRSIQEML
ncbi:MAG: ABC transporter substrate-binding protein [Micromonosporaceae bacterium]